MKQNGLPVYCNTLGKLNMASGVTHWKHHCPISPQIGILHSTFGSNVNCFSLCSNSTKKKFNMRPFDCFAEKSCRCLKI